MKGDLTMKHIIKRVEIDLYSPASYEVIKAQQGDNMTRTVEFALLYNKQPYPISNNIKIRLEGHRGDHSSFIKENCCTVSGNVISLTLDSDILYASGTAEAKIVMYDGESILSTIPFRISVQKHPCDKNTLETDKKSAIDDLIIKMDENTAKNNEQEKAIHFIANHTYKNLLRNTANTTTVNGVTFTVNSDGSVTVNGTATANAGLLINIVDTAKLVNSEFMYTGTPSAGSDTTYYTELKYLKKTLSNQSAIYHKEYGNGITLYRPNADYISLNISIKIMEGYTADNLIFRPMIQLRSISDTSYVPYTSAPNSLGDIAQLTTDNKTTMVSAVNEVNDTPETTTTLLDEHMDNTDRHIEADERTAWDEAKNDIDTLVVGGRNLLLDSRDTRTQTAYNKIIYNFGDIKPVTGEIYTIGFQTEFVTTASDGTIYIYGIFTDQTGADTTTLLETSFNRRSDPGYPDSDNFYRKQFIWSGDGVPKGIMISDPANPPSPNYPRIKVKNASLTKGKNVKTDWDYAPEDIAHSLNDIHSTLDTIEPGAEVNQNAFDSVIVKSTRLDESGVSHTSETAVSAKNSSDQFILKEGENINIKSYTTDETGEALEHGIIEISAKDTTYSNATESQDGLMSASDKEKLNEIENIYATKNSVNTITNTLLNNVSTNGRTNSLALGRNVKSGTNGDYSVAVGINVNTNSYSTALGYNSTSNVNSVAIGYNSTSNINSVAIGYNANTQTESDIAIGYNAQTSKGVAIGFHSYSENYGVAVGRYSNAVSYSVALGWDHTKSNSPFSITIGGCSISYGSSSVTIGDSLYTSGSHSITIGDRATMSANNSIAIGHLARVNNTPDGNSIAIGESANTNASNAISIGHNAQVLTEHGIAIGNNSYVYAYPNSIAIGCNALVTGNCSTAIGYGAATCSANSIQLGSSSSLSSITARVGITVTSDERDKADIVELEDKAIEFLNKIKTIRYVYNNRELYIPETLSDEERQKKDKFGLCEYDKEAHAAGTKKKQRVRIGVLAQDTQKALKEVFHDLGYADLVNDNFFDYSSNEIPEGVENQLGVNYEKFIPFLIKGIQEIDKRLTQLEERIP